MRATFDPGARPRALDALLGELPSSMFDDRIYACCEISARYATDLSRLLLDELGLSPALRRGTTFDRLMADGRFVATFGPALQTLLSRLVEAGDLERSSSPQGELYRTVATPAADLEGLRRDAERLGTGATATLDLFDAAAAAYPAVARGESSGEKALFAAGLIGLWLAYFSNDNPAYILNNTLAARVAANRVAELPALRILEVGAGAGSASRALLAELELRDRLDRVELYDYTEPSPFFRRRGERELHALYPGLPLRVRALDIDLPLAAQACRPADYDLVLGVNVLHVATDLPRSLRALRELLRPGGWLVAGECLRLFPGQSVPADLVFQLFESFTGVVTDPDTRPQHGFLEPRHWMRGLSAAGFDPVEIVPDLERVRDVYPRFFTGVVCGRAPYVP